MPPPMAKVARNSRSILTLTPRISWRKSPDFLSYLLAEAPDFLSYLLTEVPDLLSYLLAEVPDFPSYLLKALIHPVIDRPEFVAEVLDFSLVSPESPGPSGG